MSIDDININAPGTAASATEERMSREELSESREKLILGNLPAFPDSAERYPPGTEEWAARVTLRTHYAIEHVQEHGIGELYIRA
jgi:hypothetical protein